MKFDIGAMSVGDILDRGLKILLARLPTFYLIYLITLAPLLVFQLLVIPLLSADPSGPPSPDKVLMALAAMMGVLAVTLILSPIGTGAVLHVIGQEFVDEKVGVGEAFSFALGRFAALLGTSMLYTLIFMAGYIMCCIPGLFVAVFFAFFPQVVVMEHLAGMTALNRSKELVTGFGWRVFGILFLLGLIIFGLSFLLGIALNILLPAHAMVQTQFGPQQGPINNYPFFILQTVISFLVSIIGQTYSAICTTLLYFDLRIRKEGFDLEMAARQQRKDGDLDQPQEPEYS
jgi:hypothetical protein